MKPLKAITTEQIIPLGEKRQFIFDNVRCVLRVHDEAAGPFLSIEGQNDEPDDDGENPRQFFLCSHDEIDQFAAICHDLLRQAEVE